MSYNDEELEEEKGFKISLDNEEGYDEEEPIEPLEETGFGFEDDDPDKDH